MAHPTISSEPPATDPFADDKWNEECAVFGIWGSPDAAQITALGLHALQHRGQEACGIVAFHKDHFKVHRAIGLVGDVFGQSKGGDDKAQVSLKGRSAIGHTRYATSGATARRNIQPLWTDLEDQGGFALAHNGNLTNAQTLKRRLRAEGRRFWSTTDTEVILDLVAASRQRRLVPRLVDALTQVKGAYSVVALSKKKLIGVRDPAGVRPLVLGRLDDGGWIIASETCGLDIVGANFVRDIKPGEMVVIDESGVESLFPFAPQGHKFCIFEYIYFSRPDSIVEGKDVYNIRKSIGRELAKQCGIEADMVVPVPDSGTPAAIGYAEESGLPFDLAITRNHYVGRTFIEPTQNQRALGVRRKLNANPGMLEGKRVILVDDSVVRGTTARQIVRMVRDAGAKEVHICVASPPTMSPCFYGVDTPSKAELIVNQYDDLDQIAKHIDADSLHYLTVEGLYRAVGAANQHTEDSRPYCDACFTGDYPIELTDEDAPPQTEHTVFSEVSE